MVSLQPLDLHCQLSACPGGLNCLLCIAETALLKATGCRRSCPARETGRVEDPVHRVSHEQHHEQQRRGGFKPEEQSYIGVLHGSCCNQTCAS